MQQINEYTNYQPYIVGTAAVPNFLRFAYTLCHAISQ